MSYPSHAEYNLAIRYIGKFVSDPILKSGIPRSRNAVAVEKGGEPLCYPGGFANVYKVDCGAKTYALRVWLHEVSDAAKRYQATAEFLKKNRLPFFVEHFEFIPKGILAAGQRFPILRMEWVEGYSLADFIKLNLNQPDLLLNAAETFAAIAAELHRNRIGHGDLQSENVVLQVSHGTVRFKLIDYDTLVVPALLGQPTVSAGLPSYQHPNRGRSTTTTEKDDYFSELVIYTCLCALAENPKLWAEFPASGRDKELLFDAGDFDFTATVPSALFQCLYQMGGKVARLAVVLWNFTRCPSIQLLLPLEKVIELVTPPAAAPDTSVQPKNNGSAFQQLLKRKLTENEPFKNALPNSWLDDSSFLVAARQTSPLRETSSSARPQSIAPSPKAEQPVTIQSSPSGSASTQTFRETMARMNTPSSSSPSSSSPSELSGATVCFIIIISIFIIFVLASNCKGPQSKVSSAGQVVPQPTPRSEQTPPPLSNSLTDRRALWKTDIERRRDEYQAKRKNHLDEAGRGITRAESDSYDARRRAAEEQRTELEREIKEFNSSKDAPARYQ